MSAGVSVERLDARRGPPRGAFVSALLEGRGPACGFLPEVPRTDAAWDAALDAHLARASRPPAAWVEALALRQRALGAGPRAEANARALGDSSTLVVVTGQQPGLLGGPLLTFHKAAGAIHLAGRLDGRRGRRVVPVFWLASEDHDLDEANRLLLLDEQGQPRRLSLPLDADGRSLMHRDVPTASAAALLAEVAALLPDTDRARAALALVQSPGPGFAAWSAASLLRLLGDAGLVLVEPDVLLPFAGEALALLLEQAREIRRALVDAGARLEAAGLPAPLAPAPDEAPLFLREEARGPRLRVSVTDAGRVRVRGRAGDEAVRDVARRLRETPALGSGDAAGRVFVQDRLLPMLAYVAGPTEIAYHAQVRTAHDAVGLPYPLALPRPAATWVDERAERAATAFGRPLGDVLAAGSEAAAEPPAPPDEADLEAALAAWEAALGRLPPALAARADGSGEAAAALARSRARLEAEARRQVEQVRAALQRERGVGADRWARLGALLWPRGRPQERSLSPLHFVARYGVEALRAGLLALDPLQPGHHLVRLGSTPKSAP